MTLKKVFNILTVATCLTFALSAQAVTGVSFVGSSHKTLTVTPERNTGLDMIYVVYDMSQVSEMTINGVSADVSVSKYSNLGGGYAQPLNVEYVGGTVTINNPEGDIGYIVEDSGRPYYFWVTDYHSHMLSLSSAAPSPEQDCISTRIEIAGQGDAIHFFSIDGRQCELDRDIEVEYSNLEWSDDSESYVQSDFIKTLAHLSNPVIITPPLYCNSMFDITGDRFLKQWGLTRHIESPLVYANGLDVHTSAEQTNITEDDPDGDASNMIKTEVAGMGGSAPADISFRAWTTDAVIHNEWQIAADSEFEYIDYRFNEQNLDYTFTEEGTYYVRFVGSNSDGSCETVGETYTIGIGSSELRIPNAFTPNEDGVNDVWKVSYRSLLSFSCTIFDRYGNQIIHFTDPTQGWDGKYKGKYVKPGVYFYVIEAKGADGRNYKKGGDINIIKSKRYEGNGSSNSPVSE